MKDLGATRLQMQPNSRAGKRSWTGWRMPCTSTRQNRLGQMLPQVEESLQGKACESTRPRPCQVTSHRSSSTKVLLQTV